MTRINLIDPSLLADQHLFAEWREIKHVPKALARSLKACDNNLTALKAKIPKAFTLNTGHVTFFYNKGEFLQKRFKALQQELDKREHGYNRQAPLDPLGVFTILPMLCNDYTPDERALQVSLERIEQRLSEKPTFYKYYGKPYNKV